MTNFYCAYCGVKGLKSDMLVSKHTGNAYCRDDHACAKRKSKAVTKAMRADRQG